MAQSFRASLIQQAFPVDFRQLGDTVLLADSSEAQESGSEIARPQVYALQNALPTQRGWVSAHFSRVVESFTCPVYLEQCFQILEDGVHATLCGVAGDSFYVLASDGTWVEHPFVTAIARGAVTYTTFRGQTYVCVGRVGLFRYDFTLETMELLTVTGIADFADVLGVCNAGNHLILYTAELVLWSDPVDPLEFTPALGSAGSTGIAANRSSIVAVLPLGDGFVVYTALNAVYGAYTGNPNAPLAFREVANSSGIEAPEHVSFELSGTFHYAWTFSGFQRVFAQRAEQAWTELSDAIASGIATFIGTANTPAVMHYDRLAVKVSTVGARYVCVSVKTAVAGGRSYPTAYIYDVALERFGRIDVDHSDIIEFRAATFSRHYRIDELTSTIDSLTSAIDDLVAQGAIREAAFGKLFAMVSPLGAVHVVLPATVRDVDTLEDVALTAAPPTLMLGKYATRRGRAVCCTELQLQGNVTDATLRVHTHDAAGNWLRVISPTASLRVPNKHTLRATGSSVTVQVSGRFDLTALSFTLQEGEKFLQPVAETANGVPIDYMTIGGVPVTAGGEYVVSP